MSKNNKNITSIAIRINSAAVRDLFINFLLIDIFLIFVLLTLWCIEAEKSFYGELVSSAKRSFDFFPIEASSYKVIWNDGRTMIKEAGEFLQAVKTIMIVIGIVEGVSLLEQIIFGTAKIRKSLKPLDEIAEAASRLSNMDFDEEKFRKDIIRPEAA